MAVVLEHAGQFRRFVGESTHEKPVPTSEYTIAAGTLFLETDTRRLFLWNGTGWGFYQELPGPQPDASVWTAILGELRRIRFGIETVLQQKIPDPGE